MSLHVSVVAYERTSGRLVGGLGEISGHVPDGFGIDTPSQALLQLRGCCGAFQLLIQTNGY